MCWYELQGNVRRLLRPTTLGSLLQFCCFYTFYSLVFIIWSASVIMVKIHCSAVVNKLVVCKICSSIKCFVKGCCFTMLISIKYVFRTTSAPSCVHWGNFQSSCKREWFALYYTLCWTSRIAWYDGVLLHRLSERASECQRSHQLHFLNYLHQHVSIRDYIFIFILSFRTVRCRVHFDLRFCYSGRFLFCF